ncbi:peptidoglycan-binding protein [Tateyamaria armeniaca]|uniref:Peptidoglycan-binding protein n=1 Tax=Tateyamaria armeniaca TaxID=2518930 RepID=A0ABW8UZX0_9RHOB
MAQLDWAKIQRRLKELGFAPGPVDGIRGAKTIAAIRAFQKKYRLVADGIVGNKTYRALFGKSPASAQSVMTAAHLVAIAYQLDPRKETDGDTRLDREFGLHVTKRCTVKGVEAYMLNNETLLIPGSNSLADYLRFNLRIWALGTRRLTFREEAKKQKVDKRTKLGFSRTIWHQGFLRHANKIHHWVGKNPRDWPKVIVGHSLGAAAAQILSKTWAAPAIGFAAPRPRKSHGKIALDGLSLSICRDDDIVCYLPSSFHRTGQSMTLRHASPKSGLNHDMDAYIDALNNRKPGLGIPQIWDP